MTHNQPPDIVVAGGGVAAIEFVRALRALMGDGVRITVVAPNHEFVLRPLLVAAPLDADVQWRRPLAEIATDIGFALVTATVTGVDPDRSRIIARSGDAVSYDTLVFAPGARTLPAYDDAVQLGDAAGARGLQELREEVRQGTVQRVAFVVPSRAGWIIPLYEAALLTANADDSVSVSVITPEERPLEQFGKEASAAVAQALREAGIEFRGHGGSFDVATVDRIVSVPLVRGPQIPGAPATGLYGLIPVDDHGRVAGLPNVYAIGDATDYPVKQAGIACLQADAAESVAALHGHEIRPTPFRPELRATLLTGAGDPILLNNGQGAGQASRPSSRSLPRGLGRQGIPARLIGGARPLPSASVAMARLSHPGQASTSGATRCDGAANHGNRIFPRRPAGPPAPRRRAPAAGPARRRVRS